MAVKYYSDGTYTKGDGKLYYGNVLVGTDKSTNVSKAESSSSTPVKTSNSSSKSSSSSSSSSSKKNSSSSNKSSSNSSSNKSNYTEEVWEANGRKYVNGIDIGPAVTKVDTSNSTELIQEAIKSNNSGGSSSKTSTELEENPYEQKYNESQEAYKQLQEQMNENKNLYEQAYKDLQGLLNSNEERYKEQLDSLEQKYNDLLNAPNPYEEKYNEIQEAYKKQEEAIREQNRLAVEQGVNRLNSQKNNIDQFANDNARQAYIMQMQAKKALPQQLAGQGATGGATETANLGIKTTYQNNVNSINKQKANALQDIDNAIVDLQNTGDLSTVEQVLANNQAALDAYSANLDKSVAYNQWAQQFNANRADVLAEQAYRDKVYANQMAQQAWENSWYEKNYEDNKAQQEWENSWYEKNYADTLKQQARDNELDLMKYNQSQTEKAEKEATKIYDDVYKEAKKRWETGNVDAGTIDTWLAQQNITDAEYEAILEELGIKPILDNLYALGKLKK